MKKNYEIKCRLCSEVYANYKALLSADKSFKHSNEKQKDIYYKADHGRLKLRIINNKRSDLIFYNREERSSKRISNYLIASSDNFSELELILKHQFEISVTVCKSRDIFIKGNVRIHLDDVKDLGKFLEIEVIYKKLSEAKAQMKENIKYLNLNESDFIKVSYSDLLIKKK